MTLRIIYISAIFSWVMKSQFVINCSSILLLHKLQLSLISFEIYVKLFTPDSCNSFHFFAERRNHKAV